MSQDPQELAKSVSEAASRDGRRLAIVESLTGGLVCSDLAASPGSSEWFRGGVVAYDRTTKHGALGVPDGPVVSEPAVRTMAEKAADLLGADLTLAVSGAGGPEPQDDQPPGTVWFAIDDKGSTEAWVEQFETDEPGEVLKNTRIRSLQAILDHLGG
ncbi:CinA family protein [Actinomycetospora lemnae]|uniref:CinA family protein n=1 Tax=Actinomycetospora lemnae TaxID=3019891 RepID=A0ABT5SSE4_9PSEU|nr:CinA family protein [Actinomycetospora sp. DW7H6]MDD7965756.1 CinA family protein [Actinomycetospora sp. DW7H6]